MKRFVALGLLVIIVVAAWSAAWLWAAGEIRQYVATLGQDDGTGAPALTCENLNVGGFPFRFDVTCAPATIVSEDLAFHLPGLKASALAYNPTHLLLSPKGPLVVEDAFSGTRRQLAFADAEASVRVEAPDLVKGMQGIGWRLARASVVADGLVWSDVVTNELVLGKASHAEAHLIDIPEQHRAAEGLASLAAYAEADDVEVPGATVADGKASLEAELSGLPDDLRAFSEPDLLNRWRESAGQLKLVSLRMDDADRFVSASGTLALDSAARPEGQVKIDSKGVVEQVQTLVPEQFRGLVLGTPAADGSYSQTLTLRAGVVLSGLVPIAELPPLL